jgi:hypothetical protein
MSLLFLFLVFFILYLLFFKPPKTTSKIEKDVVSKTSSSVLINTKPVLDSKKQILPTQKPQKAVPISYGELGTEHIASSVTSKKHRITHCYNCHTSLNNRNHKECESCGWIACPICMSCSQHCETKYKSTLDQDDYDEVKSDSSISNTQNNRQPHKVWQTLKHKAVPVHEVKAYFLSALERKGSANHEHLLVYANCLSEELRGNLLKAIIFKAIPSNLDEILDEIELKKFTISDALQQAIETTMNTGTRFENKINDMSSRFNNKPGYYEEDCDGSPYDFGQDVFSASDGSPYDYSDVYDD